jgi:iron complex outermembrane receptor protein
MPGALSAAQYQADPRQAKFAADFGSGNNDNTGVFVEAKLGNWQLAADANRRTKQYSSFTYGSPYGYDVDAANYSVRARHEGRLGANANVLVLGYDKNNWDRTITQSAFTPTGTSAAASASAFYVKDDLTLPESATRISLGWRSEDLDKSEGQSASSLQQRQNAWDLGLSQPLSKALTVYGRIGRSFRLANVDEFSFTTPGAKLKAQTSRDTELGARWRTASNRVELRWYRNDLDNEIGYDPAGNGPYGPFGANINFAATRRQGLELEASHALSAALDVRFNAALRQASFTAGPYAGKDIALVPGRTLGVRADWRPAQAHTLSAGLNWVDAQSPDFANTCKMPSYTTMDVRYAYQFRNAELALGIANLSDEKYYTQAFDCQAGVVTAIYPEAGRNVTASLRLKF